MKHIIIAILLIISIPAHGAEVITGPISAKPYSVYDGDTFKAHVRIWIGQTVSTSIRLLGIDTPEIRGSKCAEEKAMALKARAALQELLKGDVELWGVRNGKYAGRVLAHVTANGISVPDALSNLGLARDRKRTRLNSSHSQQPSMPSSA